MNTTRLAARTRAIVTMLCAAGPSGRASTLTHLPADRGAARASRGHAADIIRALCQRAPAVGFIIVAACLSASCALSRVDRTLLYDTRESPWTIYYVRAHDVSPGTSYSYQLFFKNQPFAIPKHVFGSAVDIDRFLAATAPETASHHNDSVLLVLAYNVASASGSIASAGRRVVLVRAVDPAQNNQVSISDLDGRVHAVIELPAAIAGSGRPPRR